MAFLETYKQPEQGSGEIRGTQREVACSLWFPSGGAPYPVWFKFKDDNGDIQTVRDICIEYVEDKNYSGIPLKEYGCKAIVGGLLRDFKLIFYPENCKCRLII